MSKMPLYTVSRCLAVHHIGRSRCEGKMYIFTFCLLYRRVFFVMEGFNVVQITRLNLFRLCALNMQLIVDEYLCIFERLRRCEVF
ncbi:hypothetical protein DAI22_06g171503 [Oryza sativa Japonica Group]|nr:hypothetical protein DAI22_06g171503 [Oryza sativa Japonica Group]